MHFSHPISSNASLLWQIVLSRTYMDLTDEIACFSLVAMMATNSRLKVVQGLWLR